ncbi:hypothetical protein [Gordonibacter massiliensis (ex Traore et al. 2017)]|uniref:hypothetical protein n=1 Tax=Gordonibacter massiliensis (ex Traore et al. 2017) TaxID=1841863 RepID=UPI001C8CB30F|nr:hypothetical protein [Gordonibacter massiliensis (ex Traore et al. 2017)]MBX9034563.1 hypothetical protein [Gordonibacter massiliensis (ex Traore et al. 2017)]
MLDFLEFILDSLILLSPDRVKDDEGQLHPFWVVLCLLVVLGVVAALVFGVLYLLGVH